jgi:phage-related protein
MSENGSSVTRAELSAHIQRIDDNFAHVRSCIDDIKQHVVELHSIEKAKIAQKKSWFLDRCGALIDRLLPAAMVSSVSLIVYTFVNH